MYAAEQYLHASVKWNVKCRDYKKIKADAKNCNKQQLRNADQIAIITLSWNTDTSGSYF
jgi:hypothetical protein